MQTTKIIASMLAPRLRIGSIKNYSSNIKLKPKLSPLFNEMRKGLAMSIPSNNLGTTYDNQRTVYVQHTQGTDLMIISFEYTANGKTKLLNLYRKYNEPLSVALERLKLNLLKRKKPKKTKACTAEDQLDQEEPPNISICLNGIILDPENVNNIDAWIEGAILNLDDSHYLIKRNEPQVILMKLPSIIMKGFITVPGVDLANCDVHTCTFQWYRQISAQERDILLQADESHSNQIELINQTYWLRLHTGITYSPSEDDIAHYLKVVCYPSDGSKIGPTYSCLSNSSVELGPPVCPFEKRHSQTKDRILETHGFRFVSYNILADLYADSDYSRNVLFAHCPTHALDIDYRRQLLLKEIHGYNADIVCLQEVDKREFNKTFEPYFKLVSGHHGKFDAKGGQVAEGVATFFREDRFELIDSHKTILSRLIDPIALPEGDTLPDADDATHHPILRDPSTPLAQKLLSKMETIRNAIKKNPKLTKRFMDRHTIIQTNLLKPKDVPNSYVIVANTHLYFAPDADHVRLLQGSVCVKYLEFIKDFYRGKIEAESNAENVRISVIFCGDMNSSPDCGLFKLVHEGQVPTDLPDWRSNEEEAVDGLSVETNLRLTSAYQNISYTNYTPGFNGWLDYIYYELDGIECESTVPLPDHEDVIASEGIPSDVFPSDHLALVANLKIRT